MQPITVQKKGFVSFVAKALLDAWCIDLEAALISPQLGEIPSF
jgi:hypothetical protein